jgi:hypothetical protein
MNWGALADPQSQKRSARCLRRLLATHGGQKPSPGCDDPRIVPRSCPPLRGGVASLYPSSGSPGGMVGGAFPWINPPLDQYIRWSVALARAARAA